MNEETDLSVYVKDDKIVMERTNKDIFDNANEFITQCNRVKALIDERENGMSRLKEDYGKMKALLKKAEEIKEKEAIKAKKELEEALSKEAAKGTRPLSDFVEETK